MIIAVRHGKTGFNENGKEKTRGWLPIPLTLEGMKGIIATANDLEDVEGVEAIYCSDLVRAVQSAEEIAHVLVMEIEPRDALRDWNYGDMTGKELKEVLPQIHHYIDNPKEVPPKGESYEAFLKRAVPLLRSLIEDSALYIVVTHNRVMTLISALCKTKGKDAHVATMKDKGPVPPAGVMIVRHDWSIAYKTEGRA